MNIRHQEVILAEIRQERQKQDQIWGKTFDDRNTLVEWITYITKYAGNAYTHKWDVYVFRTKMLQVAAIAVAAVEAIDRRLKRERKQAQQAVA